MEATETVRMFLWDHRLLLLGSGFHAALHRHHAAQLCWALGGELRLRTASNKAWRSAPGFFIPADRSHELNASGLRVAFLFLDGQSAEYTAYLRATGHSKADVTDLSGVSVASPLRRLLQFGGDCVQAQQACRSVLGLEAGSRPSSADHRITKALEWIDANLDKPIRIAQAASAAGLSESHFAHIFVATTGVPLRRYVLWRRLRAAATVATQGANLTEAAHAAGLADSSHLSRTFRSAFGLPPSSLFDHRIPLHGHLCHDLPSRCAAKTKDA